jgi:hypothetical protein
MSTSSASRMGAVSRASLIVAARLAAEGFSVKPQQIDKYLHTLYSQLAPRLTRQDPAESGFASALAAAAEVDAAAVAQANAVSWHSMLDPKVEEQVFRVGCALTPVVRVALGAAPTSTGEAYRVQERLCGLPRAVADRTNVWQSRAMTGVLQVTALVGAELDLAVRRNRIK